MAKITRRTALQQLGVGIAVAGCGGGVTTEGVTDPPKAEDPKPDAGTTNPQPDAGTPVVEAGGPEPTAKELLAGIEAIVVLMMENRSFDHFFGALKKDSKYANASKVDGLNGNESNLDAKGTPVPVFKMDNFTPEDPPHGWDAVHRQFNGGKNDGFVKEHEGASEKEVMGFHDRSQIPFYYWLADNFTICDRWYCSVLGPTWPNRYYLHSGTSKGRKGNTPITPAPDSVWDRLKAAGKTYKNYYSGPVAWYFGAFATKMLSLNPTARMDAFFDDAKNGKLPAFSIIDPDFTASDDHPAHNIQRGQAFVASVYKALAESPQWNKTLFIVTYDEHGGFYDHVPPPIAPDEEPEFRQFGFRVPAIVAGGMVRRGYVDSTQYDHVSVAATLATKFGIASFGQRMDMAKDLSATIDPKLLKAPAGPPPGMPTVSLTLREALEDKVGTWSQEELERMVYTGEIPARYVDKRSHTERLRSWLHRAVDLGAVNIIG
jgi:phospholipase C